MRTLKITTRIKKLEQSIRLQERTLANLQHIDCVDGGRAVDLTRQILFQLRGCLAVAQVTQRQLRAS